MTRETNLIYGLEPLSVAREWSRIVIGNELNELAENWTVLMFEQEVE